MQVLSFLTLSKDVVEIACCDSTSCVLSVAVLVEPNGSRIANKHSVTQCSVLLHKVLPSDWVRRTP